MPRLYVCGKGLRIAGDEIQIPMLCAFWSRMLWITILIVILYLDFPDFSKCINGIVLLVYLILSISNLGIAMILDMLLLAASLRGTIIQTYKRRYIPSLFVIRMITSFFEVFLPILGTIGLTINNEVPCNAKVPRSSVNKFIFGVIVISQIVDIGFLATCYCLVVGDNTAASSSDQSQQAPQHRQSHDSGTSNNSTHLAKMEDKFRKFARQIEYYGCSNFGGGKVDESLEGVANVMTKYFESHGFIDVVPSDIVAGIILVRAEQRRNRHQAWQRAKQDAEYSTLNHEEEIKETLEHTLASNTYTMRRIALLPKGILRLFESDAQHSPLYDLHTLRTTARCATYSAMIYNRFVPIRNECCVQCCQVTSNAGVRLCGCCWMGTSSNQHKDSIQQLEEKEDGTMNIAGMNFIGYNRFGLNKLEENVVNSELIFLSHYNDMVHKPFAVFLDHELELVVIAIRGTVSVEDCLSDVACEPVELTLAGLRWGFNGEHHCAHSGMLRAALAIREGLEQAKILDRIYGTGSALSVALPGDKDVRGTFDTPLLSEGWKYSHYHLTVTGHSLGAGTAVLLTMLLRSQYPNVHCYGFGAPGSVLDRESCTDCRDYITTVVLGNDIVPRLSFRSLCLFRRDVLSAIARAKVNKAYIMQSVFRDLDAADLLYEEGSEPPSDFQTAYLIYQDSVERQLQNSSMVETFLPGKIVQLVKTSIEWKKCVQIPHYSLIDAIAEDFTEIAVSRTMLTDHMPDKYYQEMQNILKSRLDAAEKITTVNPLIDDCGSSNNGSHQQPEQ